LAHATWLTVPLINLDVPLDQQVQAARAAGADVIELRLDCLRDPEAVANLLAGPRTVPFILTIRTRAEGGQWDGDDAARGALLERLGALRPGYIDLEYASWVRAPILRRVAEQARAGGNQLILSHHDVHGTPGDLDGVLAPLLASSADVVKLAFAAHDAADAWRAIDVLRRHAADRPMVALSLGDAGLLTRVLAGKFGARLTFAALRPGAESAPGQPTLAELLNGYHWRDVGPRTRVYGVVGWPVAHSRSPALHNAAMAATHIDGVMVPMPVAPSSADWAAFIDYLTAHPEFDVQGLSITIPHKEHALRWLHERVFDVTDVARRAGAVNTLTRAGPARWTGDNTDVAGASAALRAGGLDILESTGRRAAAVLGAGGAARAVIVGLQDRGWNVTVFNRTADRAGALAREFRCQWQPWEERVTTYADLVVNCTSVGMEPHADESPLPADALRPEMLVFDAVYTPAETRLLREARVRGARVVSGVEMFRAQAAAQFERWHRRTVPLELLRAALDADALTPGRPPASTARGRETKSSGWSRRSPRSGDGR